ncbi:MAG: hypothetical protein JO112_08035, partial [Planctomycetes bacterium]|nr:hypothetical protein [Planctomycetota bacterium]
MKYVISTLGMLLVSGSLHAAARVAVVATQRSDPVRNLLDLTEAELGAEKDIQLLERSANDRILAEHELSLSGLVDVNKVVAAGKLLSLDLFAVVETDPSGKDALGLVVFDAGTGVRLWDAALPAGEAQKTAKAAAEDIRAAVRKRAAGWKNLRPVCLLGVRNADLQPEMNSFSQFVALLLERRLVNSEGVVVLERKRLEFVNQERALPTPAPEKELLASLLLIELEVKRAPQGHGLSAVAFVKDSKGKPLHQVSAEVKEARAADLAEPLVQGLGKYLHIAPAPPAEARGEANSFLREAQLMWNHQQLLQGLQAAESAEALDPASAENQALLAQYLLSYAVYLLDPQGMTMLSYGSGIPRRSVDSGTLKTSLELARRGVETRRNVLSRMQPRTRRALALDMGRNFSSRASLRHFLNRALFVDFPKSDAEVQNLLQSFREEVDRLLLDELDAWAEVAANSPVEPQELKGSRPDSVLSQYMWRIKEDQELFVWNSPNSAAYTSILTRIMQRWLEVSAKVNVNQYQLWHLTWFLQDMTPKLAAPAGVGEKPSAEEATQVLEVFQGMERHPHPLISLYGRAGQILVGLATRQLSPAEARQKFQAIQKLALDQIQNPPVQPADEFRVGGYKFLAFGLERLSSQVAGRLQLNLHNDPALYQRELAPIVEEFYAVCDFMLSRGELVEEVITTTLDYGGSSPAYGRKKLERIDRALALAGTPRCRLF